MKGRAIICMMLALCISSSVTVHAAPKIMPDGTVFDPEYYAEQNPDVAAELGSNENALYQHYILFGETEGRKPYMDSTESDDIQPETNYMERLCSSLPVFPAEVTARNNVLVPVVLEPLDGHYLKYTNVVTRTHFGTDGSRKDYSNDPIYLAARDYIVEWLNNNGDDESNRVIEIPITFRFYDEEESRYFRNMVDNLEIDLHKSEICKNKTLYMGVSAADGKSHIGFGYEATFFCLIEYWETPEELFNEQSKDEIPINPTTGRPAEVGDSWDLGNGTTYMIL